ncbi:sodium-translocating pyrophosphatase [Candidatus Woesearchaeota archaeon]|nr:sodium-translocating pyrophosphatase [Candidatus Woesearchaeota archaeon]
MLVEVNVLASLIGVLIAIFFTSKVLKKSTGSKEMRFYANAIQEGALTFLKKEYEVIFIFAALVFAILSYFIGIEIAISFATGAIFSAMAGFSAMMLATRANVRTTESAKKSFKAAIDTAFSSSIVIGLTVTSTGLLGVTALYLVFREPSIIYGFALGASSIALFARVGGGIFTKAADVAADIVGKVESKIHEDDPRNPAVIADNVGDEVGDVAGMGADLFESYVGSIIATMAIASIIADPRFIILPLMIASIGIISSIITMYMMRKHKNYKTLMLGCFVFSGLLVILISLFVIKLYLPQTFMLNYSMYTRFGVLIAIVSGVFAGTLIGWVTKKYTYTQEKHVKDLAEKSQTGAATNILEGLALGMRSSTPIVLFLAVSILISYYFASIYGIALSAVSLLSTLAVTLAVDAFGPISDNAQGIAVMARLNKKVRQRTGMLDSIGNTTAAIGKGFAITSSAYTALAFFFTYVVVSGLNTIDLVKPRVIVGLLVGGVLAFFFSSMTIKAVGNAANTMIKEVRRQFRQLKLLVSRKNVPEYNRCIEISTRSALREMIVPGFVAVITPILLGLLLGAESVAGMLAGCLVASVLLGITMFNSGAAWDNAKRLIEKKGIKGETYMAAVVGDTVGDPLKDTAGPSLNILIKLISIISLIILPFILSYGPLINI